MTQALHWRLRSKREDEHEEGWPDWVIAYRLVRGEEPGRTPTEAEIRLTVWFLLDQGRNVAEVIDITGLPEKAVVRTYDLRRLATKPDRPRGPGGARNPQAARALVPYWYDVWLLGGAYARDRKVALSAAPVGELVGAGAR